VDIYLDSIDIKKYCSKCDEKCRIEESSDCKFLDMRILPEIPMVEIPMPVKTGLFEMNEPDKKSPVIVTGNFLYTHTLLGAVLINAKIDCYVLSIDTEGHPVDMAAVLKNYLKKSSIVI
jgi:hypothetical protein